MAVSVSQPSFTPLTPYGEAAPSAEPNFWGGDGFGVDDFIDLINPLQHIPVVSTIYRGITGDTIAPAARVIGGALTGGIVGAASSLANVAVEAATGTDIAGNALALLDDAGDAFNEGADTNAPYSTASSAPLQADTGSALLAQMLAGTTEVEEKPTASSITPEEEQSFVSAMTNRLDNSLGMGNAYKKTQYMAQLDKKALDIVG